MSQALPSRIPAGHVLLRVAFAGVNASDVNFTAGRYQASIAEAEASLPFDAGFEAVGAVAAVGPQVSGTIALTLPYSIQAHQQWTCYFLRLSHMCNIAICCVMSLSAIELHWVPPSVPDLSCLLVGLGPVCLLRHGLLCCWYHEGRIFELLIIERQLKKE